MGDTHIRHVALEVLDFLNDILILSDVNGRRFDVWNMDSGTAPLNGKGRNVQHPKLSHLVSGIDDYLSSLDERKSEDGVDCDIRSGRNQE